MNIGKKRRQLYEAFLHICKKKYQLYEAFLRVRSTKCDTVEQNFEKCPLYEGKTLVSNPRRPLNTGRMNQFSTISKSEPHHAEACLGEK